MLPKIIFIMGPTAVGKTNLAFELHQFLPIEIISVDTALIYRNMNIGTDKPNSKKLEKVPHHLIDILDPIESYSVARFYLDVFKKIKKIIKIGHTPVLVGGTMFYFKTLLEGLNILPNSNPDVRMYIRNQAQKIGWNNLYIKLQKLDPVIAKRIHSNDIQRLSRALEILYISGCSITTFKNSINEIKSYKVLQFIIKPNDIRLLHQKIEKRFYQMLSNGLENEVKLLLSKYNLNEKMQSMRCIGYKQMLLYLSNIINYNEMILQTIHDTKKLAKHQITWLKKWNNAFLLENNQINESIKIILNTFYKIN